MNRAILGEPEFIAPATGPLMRHAVAVGDVEGPLKALGAVARGVDAAVFPRIAYSAEPRWGAQKGEGGPRGVAPRAPHLLNRVA